MGGSGSGDEAMAVAVLLIMTTLVAVVEGGTWCVASSHATAPALQWALNYACQAGVNCRPIQPGGSCYLPNTLQNHASFAIDSFYQLNNKNPKACDFSGIATISITDPSYGSCNYPSSASSVGGAALMPTSSTPNPNTPIKPNSTTPPSFSSNGGSGG